MAHGQTLTDLVNQIVDEVVALTRPFIDMLAERERQDEKWGEQHHPDGTTSKSAPMANYYRDSCDRAFAAGDGTWAHILLEEVFEALAEEDQQKLRTELVQVGAVAAAWIEDIDSREKEA